MFKGWFSQDKKKEEQKVDDEVDIDDEELEQKGIDPSQIPDEEVQEGVLADVNNLYKGYLVCTEEEIWRIVDKYNHFPISEDEIRCDDAHHKGGRKCVDHDVIKQLRSVGKEVIKQIGKSIFSGSLTKISFPIKAMIPQTTLEAAVNATCLFPLYLNKAAKTDDAIERIKLVITWTLSSFYWTNTFLKPLNPILGETLQASFPDGTEIYCEQISHHPPISYFLVIGKNNLFRYYGYYNYDASAGLNSVTIINKGKRYIEFPHYDCKIEFDFPNEKYSGTLMGTLQQQSYGKMTFTDNTNNLKAEIMIGKVKQKPSDFIEGKIAQGPKVVSELYGSYMGFIDFDKIRYWDFRMVTPVKFQLQDSILQSNHSHRKDLITLAAGDLATAQKQKENGEQVQRTDAKLRKQHAQEMEKLEKERKKAQKQK